MSAESTLRTLARCHCDGRCPHCGWPLKMKTEHGCVPGNCMQRPVPNSDAKECPDCKSGWSKEGRILVGWIVDDVGWVFGDRGDEYVEAARKLKEEMDA